MKVTEFDVKRPQWLRGEGPGSSALLRRLDGKMCCLGFYCLAAGCSRDQIEGVQVPSEMVTGKGNITELLLPDWNLDPTKRHPDVVNDLMTANDRPTSIRGLDIDIHSEEEREALITKLFAQMGVKVNFID